MVRNFKKPGSALILQKPFLFSRPFSSVHIINYNGQLVRADAPHFSLSNRALRYGDGLFETLRWTDGTIPLWPYHVERLTSGLRALHLEVPDIENVSMYFLREISRLALGAGSYRIRLIVFRAGGGTYAPETDRCEWVVEARKIDDVGGEMRCQIYEEHRLAPHPLSRFKTINALPYVLAAREARRRGLDDLILLNTNGLPVESTSCGLAVQQGTQLIAPPIDAGGVLSTYLRYLEDEGAAARGWTFERRAFSVEELLASDRIWLCNAVAGMRLVTMV